MLSAFAAQMLWASSALTRSAAEAQMQDVRFSERDARCSETRPTQ
jgi:hypothetical protein